MAVYINYTKSCYLLGASRSNSCCKSQLISGGHSAEYCFQASEKVLLYRHRMSEVTSLEQGDHLSGKSGHVREFDSCQRNVRFNYMSEKCRGKNLVRKGGLNFLL